MANNSIPCVLALLRLDLPGLDRETMSEAGALAGGGRSLSRGTLLSPLSPRAGLLCWARPQPRWHTLTFVSSPERSTPRLTTQFPRNLKFPLSLGSPILPQFF